MIACALIDDDTPSPKLRRKTRSGGTLNSLSNAGTENISAQTKPVTIETTKGRYPMSGMSLGRYSANEISAIFCKPEPTTKPIKILTTAIKQSCVKYITCTWRTLAPKVFIMAIESK